MSELSAVRVLVTGAAGFIGSNLTRALLREEADVHALTRAGGAVPAGVAVHRADLRDADAVSRAIASARPEVVVHLAAAAGHARNAGERAGALADTVLGTANLLEALRALDLSRLVHIGSGLEYGHAERPLREVDPLDPVTFRGAAKGAASLLTLELGHATGTPVTVLRPFAVYGPWERPPRFVPTVVTAALRGEPISVTAGEAGRDFVFVEDVVDACLAAATAAGAVGEVINVGTGRLTTSVELVERLAAVSGLELDVRVGVHEPRAWDSGRWVADVRKAQDVLGWRAAHDLDAGLAKTLAWFAGREARDPEVAEARA